MRTNIVIDDEIMQRAMKLSGCTTKKSTVEAALELMIRLKEQEKLKSFRGKLKWEGDLDQMRTDK
ncbi:type II toxin-antitoxin system VapB family antitoxin [Marivirga tractuosa]|uniref:type II toxin-antitoxin system VapB family antitoxin n=1 Tax=Marivirga tractuosa TaxID=1006 RepID=UPI0035CFA872